MDIKALTPDGKKLNVKGIRAPGSIMRIKAIPQIAGPRD
jgi:hypothetical protein